jgi:hypothetical protein
MVALAVGPEAGEDTGCVRASETPDTGSAFDEVHTPLAGFFFAAQAAADSPFAVGVPFNGCVGTETVDVDDDDDAIDDDELVLCTPFLGMNILDTSSALIGLSPPCPVLLEFHPSRGND